VGEVAKPGMLRGAARGEGQLGGKRRREGEGSHRACSSYAAEKASSSMSCWTMANLRAWRGESVFDLRWEGRESGDYARELEDVRVEVLARDPLGRLVVKQDADDRHEAVEDGGAGFRCAEEEAAGVRGDGESESAARWARGERGDARSLAVAVDRVEEEDEDGLKRTVVGRGEEAPVEQEGQLALSLPLTCPTARKGNALDEVVVDLELESAREEGARDGLVVGDEVGERLAADASHVGVCAQSAPSVSFGVEREKRGTHRPSPRG